MLSHQLSENDIRYVPSGKVSSIGVGSYVAQAIKVVTTTAMEDVANSTAGSLCPER